MPLRIRGGSGIGRLNSSGAADMTAPKSRRQRLFADRHLQGALLAHTTIYWFYCLFSVTLIAVCWIIFSQQPDSSSDLFTQLWLSCGPALLGSVLLLPLVLLDCLRLSNRFAGPMLRFQRAMRELAEEGHTKEITLRKGDYWSEFARDLNIVAERLQGLPATEANKPSLVAEPSQPLAETIEFEVSEEPAAQPTASQPAAQKPAAPLPPLTPAEGPVTAHNLYSDLSI
jgi:hypothetical protein